MWCRIFEIIEDTILNTIEMNKFLKWLPFIALLVEKIKEIIEEYQNHKDKDDEK